MTDPAPATPAKPAWGARLRGLLASRAFIACACTLLGLAAANAAVIAAIAAASHPRATNWPAPGYVFWPLRSWRTVERRLDDLPRSVRLTRGVLATVTYRGVTLPIPVLHFRPDGGSGRPLKVLLVSGVHGTEVAGVEALLSLAEDLARDPSVLPSAQLDVVPVANPWGWVYGYRYNGDGEDMNRDFASRRTREAEAIRQLVARNGPYDLVMDLHESKKYGYFVYQYLPRGPGLGEEYTRILREMGKPAQENYREGLFRTRAGVLRIPAVALPWIAAARQLSLEHYTRLHGTPQSYTVETPLWDGMEDRVRVHRKTVGAFLGAMAAAQEPAPALGR